VAHHTGLSERHFRREQERAIDILGEHLLSQFERVPQKPVEKRASAQVEESGSGPDEWDWLRHQPAEGAPDLEPFIQELFGLMDAVANQHHVELQLVAPEKPPRFAVHPIALRQMLLNLLQVAICRADGGRVVVTVESGSPQSRIVIQPHAGGSVSMESRYEQESNLLNIAANLARVSGGRAEIARSDADFQASLILPVIDGVLVAAIDDHPEILDLLQRYAEGTRYHITGLIDPEQIFELAAATTPQIIVLDVMMPKVDGWEMLGRLRSHPQTAGIPVIVLTILAQEDLALSLGAKALVLKPVTQERFLSALGSVFASSDSSSR
jgi:CheY-like chemotaxis protein